MLRKNLFIIALSLLAASVCAQYKVKMFHYEPPAFGRFKLKIIPIAYDSTVTDSSIINCIDTLPSYLFGARTYHLMYKNDTNKLAVAANEHGMFRRKFYITEYWKNGNIKRLAIYKRHSKHYICYIYYVNDILAARGKYRNNKKIGKWIYINTGGKKIRVEHYACDGTLKKAKNFKPPRSTFATMFNAAHPEGKPYNVQ